MKYNVLKFGLFSAHSTSGYKASTCVYLVSVVYLSAFEVLPSFYATRVCNQ